MRGFHTVTHRFQEVTRSGVAKVKCSGCRKDRSRSIRVTHTVNPYNRNEDGSVRTPQEVLERVHAELADLLKATEAKPVVCKTCLQDRVSRQVSDAGLPD